MSYSCVDFVDSILEALGIVVPLESQDCPQDQANLAMTEIERLQAAVFALKAKVPLPPMDRMLYLVAPTNEQCEVDEDGPVNRDVFVWATDASEAVKLWRKREGLDEDDTRDDYGLGLTEPVRVFECPLMDPYRVTSSMLIDWSQIHAFGATITGRVEL